MSYARIAEPRGIKPVNVRNAIYGIQRKLGVRTMHGLVLWCVSNGLVENLVAAGAPVTLNGPRGEGRHPGNANLQFQSVVGEQLLGMLQPCVAASSGAACASGIPEPSHVLRAMGLSGEDADSSLRFSFGRFTTGGDINGASSEVLEALERMA